jgi:Nickel responsive protein SCO4226-like
VEYSRRSDGYAKCRARHRASVVLREHKADLKTQATYTVNHLGYWFDEKRRKVFCLIEAVSPRQPPRANCA